MGHYTRLTFKGKLKDDRARAIFSQLLEFQCWEKVEKEPEVIEWLKVDRANFIPYGFNVFLGDKQVKPRITDDHFIFDCSLKNYEGEIEEWLRLFKPLFETAEFSIEVDE